MNYKNSLLALLLLSCSTALPITFNPENQDCAQEMFCRTMDMLKDQCCDNEMIEQVESLGLQEWQNDAECIELACRMARMMKESDDCSFAMIRNSFADVDAMKVIAAYGLCQSCRNDLMTEEEETANC